jgi:hypothetical protein
VKLKLTGEEDQELIVLKDHMRKDIMVPNPLSSFANLMATMGN